MFETNCHMGVRVKDSSIFPIKIKLVYCNTSVVVNQCTVLTLRTSEAGIPAARYVNARRRTQVYRLCFLMCTGTGMPES